MGGYQHNRSVVRVNHRGILEAACEVAGVRDQFIDVVTSLDKLTKIGTLRTIDDMVNRGIPLDSANELVGLFQKNWSVGRWYEHIRDTDVGAKAEQDLERFRSFVGIGEDQKGEYGAFKFDWTLARGLSYYTGCIFEVEVDTSVLAQADIKMGSIAAGGRYANLAEAFGGKGMSGVGISFGAERIYDVLEELGAWPDTVTVGRQVLLAAFDEESLGYAFAKTQELRAASIRADCYPEPAKPKKSLGYANNCGIPYAILIGDRERESGRLALKDLRTGEQESLTVAEVVARLTDA